MEIKKQFGSKRSNFNKNSNVKRCHSGVLKMAYQHALFNLTQSRFGTQALNGIIIVECELCDKMLREITQNPAL